MDARRPVATMKPKLGHVSPIAFDQAAAFGKVQYQLAKIDGRLCTREKMNPSSGKHAVVGWLI